MRALIYCRVSDDKAHGRSIREQEAESRELCKREGWDVALVIADTAGASRHSKGKRTGWDRVCSELEAGNADVLVVWEASRAGRNLSEYTTLRDLCVRCGVRLSYGGTVYDLTDSRDRTRTAIDAIFAEEEADKISARVQRAVRANVAAGRPHGRRLYGYRRVYDPHTGALVRQEPDPTEAPVVRRIFADYLAGVAIRSIERRLNDDGIPTMSGKEWSYTQIRRILDNPGYAARRTHKGEVVGPADWPPLIEPEAFDRVQLRRRALYVPQPSARAHLLTGVARCGVCGGKVTTFVTHGRRVYQCRSHHVARDQTKLDTYMRAALIARLEQIDDIGEGDDLAVVELRDRIAEVEDRWEQLAERYATGKVSAAMLVRVEKQIQAELADLRQQLRRVFVPASPELPTADVAEWWDALTGEERRAVVAAAVDVLVINKTRRGSRTFDPDDVDIVWR